MPGFCWQVSENYNLIYKMKIKNHIPDNPVTENNRTQFQIDRVAFFSDAVIAIAITLTVLEIKIPELGTNATLKQIFAQYNQSIILHFLALAVGFWTIGNLWMRHHALYEYIVNYNEGLIRFNLFFLLSIMLLPISISFVFSANQPFHLKFLCYFINLFLCSFTYSLMVFVIFHKKNNFSSLSDKKKIKELKQESYTGTTAFFIATFLLFLNVSWYYLAFLLIPVMKYINLKKAKKKK